MTDYNSVTSELKSAYNDKAELRDRNRVQEWKKTLWSQFLRRLQAEELTSLLEIGAGTGQAARFFQDAGAGGGLHRSGIGDGTPLPGKGAGST